MHLSTLPRYAIIVATGALLTGCGGLPTPSTVRPESLQMFAHARKSWMRPDGGTQWLLYVSDYTYGVVDVYNYKDPHRLYGQLTGFGSPNGLCADTAGNVYVVDSQTYDVYEFAHGGTTPIAIAQDIYGRPNGCAFDPTTGNLAVTNGYVPPHYPGNVDVFVGGLQGSQTTYSTPVLQSYQPGGYDPSGNFFFEGYNKASTEGTFLELPAGSSTFTVLSGLTIVQPGSVQWDGSYVAATDQNYQNNAHTAIYRVTVSGSAVMIVRTTVLTDSCSPSGDYTDVAQPFIADTTKKRNTVVGGNIGCNYRVDFWNYAEGGNPKRVVPAKIAPYFPAGEAVSPPAGK
ncbi:MAG: hypothetical protein WBV40_09500 [Candidatus Cybelea sp.]|jgi:hypothetical protein